MRLRESAGLAPADAESPELYRRLVESVTDYAIYALDRRGHIVSWNAGAQRLKGYTRDEVVGRHLSLFYPPEDPGKAQRLLDEAARTGRAEDEGWRVRKDGTRFWASALIASLTDEGGVHIGFTKVTRDLTERRAAEEMRAQHAAAQAAWREAEQRNAQLSMLNDQLEEQAVELEQQAEEMAHQAEELEEQTVELEMLTEKLEETNVDLQTSLRQSESERQAADRAAASATAMTSFVSHDLRNPLNAIIMASALLTESGLDAARASQQLAVIRRAAEQMQRLIEDLLDIAKAEGSGMHVERRTESIAAIFTQAYEEFRMRAEGLGIELGAELESDLPRVYADRDRILQVLSNLLGNALKFTERGGTVTLRAVRRRDLVEVSIADTGVGIPAADLPHVFDRFWQARRSARASAGLGLAIAKSIIEAHEGAIEVESAPGRGSVFRFTLPIAR